MMFKCRAFNFRSAIIKARSRIFSRCSLAFMVSLLIWCRKCTVMVLHMQHHFVALLYGRAIERAAIDRLTGTAHSQLFTRITRHPGKTFAATSLAAACSLASDSVKLIKGKPNEIFENL